MDIVTTDVYLETEHLAKNLQQGLQCDWYSYFWEEVQYKIEEI